MSSLNKRNKIHIQHFYFPDSVMFITADTTMDIHHLAIRILVNFGQLTCTKNFFD